MESLFDKHYDRTNNDTRKWNKQLIQEEFNMNHQVIPMDIADLDFEVPEPIKEAVIKRALQGDYSYTFVTDEFYQSVIEWHKNRFNSEVKKEWLKLEYGTVPTLHHLVQIFSDQGDNILINTPVYDPFYEAIIHSERSVIMSSLINNDNYYYLDFDDLEKQLSLPNTKIFIICNPHNPSGRVWRKEELLKIAKLCIQYDVLLISDEVHRDLVYQPKQFVSMLSLDNIINQNLIICASPNKAFNLGGLKTSYIIVPNNLLREQALLGLKRFSITSPNVFALPAMNAAYKECEPWLDTMLDYIQQNMKLAAHFIEKNLPKFKVMPMDASFLLWLDVHKLLDSDKKIEEFFQSINVTCVKGSYFVKDGENFIRLNIGCSKKQLTEALERMKLAYEQFNK